MIRRTSVRLNTHRSATASGRSLTGLHPMRSPCSSSVTTGILLHCQRLSVGQYFRAPCRFPCFPRSHPIGAKKAALRQCFYGTFLGKVSLKLLRCIIVEACQVGDYRSYYRLISGSGCRSLTCRIQQRKQHPMRWAPFRMISLAECNPLRHG